jgi:hypothetical protein
MPVRVCVALTGPAWHSAVAASQWRPLARRRPSPTRRVSCQATGILPLSRGPETPDGTCRQAGLRPRDYHCGVIAPGDARPMPVAASAPPGARAAAEEPRYQRGLSAAPASLPGPKCALALWRARAGGVVVVVVAVVVGEGGGRGIPKSQLQRAAPGTGSGCSPEMAPH